MFELVSDYCNHSISVSGDRTITAHFKEKTAIKKNKKQSALTIYPNPAKNKIFIKGLQDELKEIAIYNNHGLTHNKGISH